MLGFLTVCPFLSLIDSIVCNASLSNLASNLWDLSPNSKTSGRHVCQAKSWIHVLIWWFLVKETMWWEIKIGCYTFFFICWNRFWVQNNVTKRGIKPVYWEEKKVSLSVREKNVQVSTMFICFKVLLKTWLDLHSWVWTE